MASSYPSGFYDEDALKVIEGVFRDVWDTLATSNASLDINRDGLKVAVIDQLLGLVGQGITDPPGHARSRTQTFYAPTLHLG
jgi:hypothetical protein